MHNGFFNHLNDLSVMQNNLPHSFDFPVTNKHNNGNLSDIINSSPELSICMRRDIPVPATNFPSSQEKTNGKLSGNFSCVHPTYFKTGNEDCKLLNMMYISQPTMSNDFQNSISKTKICCHNLRGQCSRGEQCSFAHSIDELRTRPNLYKTRLCINYVKIGKCLKGELCRFAHGENELRKSENECCDAASWTLNEPNSFINNYKTSADVQEGSLTATFKPDKPPQQQQNVYFFRDFDNRSSNLSIKHPDPHPTPHNLIKPQDEHDSLWTEQQLKSNHRKSNRNELELLQSPSYSHCEWTKNNNLDIFNTTMPMDPLFMQFSMSASSAADEYAKSLKDAIKNNKHDNTINDYNSSNLFINESPSSLPTTNLSFDEESVFFDAKKFSGEHRNNASKQNNNNTFETKSFPTQQQSSSKLSSPILNKLNIYQEKQEASSADLPGLNSLFLQFPDVRSNISCETRLSNATGTSDFSSVRSLATQHERTPSIYKDNIHKKSVDSTASGTTVPSTVNYNSLRKKDHPYTRNEHSKTGDLPLAIKPNKNFFASECENALSNSLSSTLQLEEQQAMQLLLSIYDNI